jgi:hypothetical protein
MLAIVATKQPNIFNRLHGMSATASSEDQDEFLHSSVLFITNPI